MCQRPRNTHGHTGVLFMWPIKYSRFQPIIVQNYGAYFYKTYIRILMPSYTAPYIRTKLKNITPTVPEIRMSS